jgi:hypothetical protein
VGQYGGSSKHGGCVADKVVVVDAHIPTGTPFLLMSVLVATEPTIFMESLWKFTVFLKILTSDSVVFFLGSQEPGFTTTKMVICNSSLQPSEKILEPLLIIRGISIMTADALVLAAL